MFDTISGWYHIYYLIFVSNLRFHDFLPTIQCARQKMMTSAKGLAYVKNLCYKCCKTYIQSCFYVKFASNWTNIKQIRKHVPVAPPQPNLFDIKKGQLL